MTESFNCPNCGAPLDFPGIGINTFRCAFCHNTIIVPQELRSSQENPGKVPFKEKEMPKSEMPSPSNPEIEHLDALASLNLSDREKRKIERAKRHIIRHQIREEVHKARHG
jgi:hypothetical protein